MSFNNSLVQHPAAEIIVFAFISLIFFTSPLINSAPSSVALLSANYIAHRLQKYYPVLYKGNNDLVAHECILDLRPLKKTSTPTSL